MHYNPGLHMLSEFNSVKRDHLFSYAACKNIFNDLIEKYELTKVGEVYHDFENGGFTAVVCLTESHLSIHTWPEFGLATFDIFLSNYQKNNESKVRGLYAEVLTFFEGEERRKTELIR